MQTLVSLPPALTARFAGLTHKHPPEWCAANDPVDRKLGSGGGTTHLVVEAWKQHGAGASFADWCAADKRIIVHAGGQSRRLPAYAPSSKALIPVPVFRWSQGQRLDQTLVDLQLPLLRRLLERAPDDARWLIASGDVLVFNDQPLPALPTADVICVGLWDDPHRASRHGVFFTPRNDPAQLSFMLQKPSIARIRELAPNYHFLLDVGIWILSARAMRVLFERCGCDPQTGAFASGAVQEFDLYGTFGPAMGSAPHMHDPDISQLSCAIVPLSHGEFYHFGSSEDIIGSSLKLQNRVIDQRRIFSANIKPHPSIFVQNAATHVAFNGNNREIWIENACIGKHWTLRSRHVLTGIPDNDWALDLPEGVCLDCVPVGTDCTAYRFYGYTDAFRGPIGDPATVYLNAPLAKWLEARGLRAADLGCTPDTDLQAAPLFPVLDDAAVDANVGAFLQWLVSPQPDAGDGAAARHRAQFLAATRLSADELAAQANLERLFAARTRRLAESLPLLARHAQRSVFHQIDLHHAASVYADSGYTLPDEAPDPSQALFPSIHDRMFRATVEAARGDAEAAARHEAEAFGCLREAMIAAQRRTPVMPERNILADQVIWGRSPVRLDLAGGWTDTPPFCFLHGGRVVNLAVELNGQPPIQVFARTCAEPHIVLRSIDLGITDYLKTYEDVASYAQIGSGFAIPKAALALAGFHPDFCAARHDSLADQLRAFGGGIEISLLCAVPKGSGLGTSSILAATVLGVLSELCSHHWDFAAIGNRTLVLEQMLTSGGGWQDQFGGIIRGIKMLETQPGLDQTPEVRWLPEFLFTDPGHKASYLLYYTGITRVAKSVLGEIVRGMFLNRSRHLEILRELGEHARAVYRTLQTGDADALAGLIGRSWHLNQALDSGTNTPAIAAILARIDPWVHGLKLLGAGGGGYLLIAAKSVDAAARIRNELESNPPNAGARFVDFNLSQTGLQVTRS